MDTIHLPLTNLPSTLRSTLERTAGVLRLVRPLGDPILKEVCYEVPLSQIDSAATKQTAKDLLETLRAVRQASGLGRGLAAPQIGYSKRMIATYFDDQFEVLINPKLLGQSSKTSIFQEM